ncbi:hypothetical protein HK099_006578 [Clydaea vesicula]|uniref:Tyrosinase copper-binding domain-containing protein n=1 Tax=Clydaea vesicula TaxID=447962 RepID=A0AAD5TY19_9FUNG|nr:hypothetical protein HK099_006578 [Clydaea vesicula]
MKLSLLSLANLVIFSVAISIPPCENTEIRKEWRELSDDEKLRYVNAINKLKTLPSILNVHSRDSSNRYEDFSYIHENYSNQFHNTAAFLPWHRMFLKEFELELKKIDSSISLPYWQWSVDSQAPERSPIFGSGPLSFGTSYGSGGACVTDGFVANWKKSNGDCLRRGTRGVKNGRIGSFYSGEVCASIVNSYKDFDSFWKNVEGALHAYPHVNLGGDMATMGSPADPLFFAHHAYIDKLWSDWQALDAARYTKYSVRARVTDKLAYYNVPVSRCLDHKVNLCYGYSYGVNPDGTTHTSKTSTTKTTTTTSKATSTTTSKTTTVTTTELSTSVGSTTTASTTLLSTTTSIASTTTATTSTASTTTATTTSTASNTTSEATSTTASTTNKATSVSTTASNASTTTSASTSTSKVSTTTASNTTSAPTSKSSTGTTTDNGSISTSTSSASSTSNETLSSATSKTSGDASQTSGTESNTSKTTPTSVVKSTLSYSTAEPTKTSGTKSSSSETTSTSTEESKVSYSTAESSKTSEYTEPFPTWTSPTPKVGSYGSYEVDAYDRENEYYIRVPPPLPKEWCDMNGLDYDHVQALQQVLSKVIYDTNEEVDEEKYEPKSCLKSVKNAHYVPANEYSEVSNSYKYPVNLSLTPASVKSPQNKDYDEYKNAFNNNADKQLSGAEKLSFMSIFIFTAISVLFI